MRLLVFQHIDCEHPGSLRQYLAQDNLGYTAVNLHRGDSIPPLNDFDALWVMGGPMDVWDTTEYPWLIDEKKAIYEWVNVLNKPYFGLCLGHQLLAASLDGECKRLTQPEIGVLQINLTEAGKQDAIMQHLPHRQNCLQWHGVEVSKMPANSTLLASSNICRVQAMCIGQHAWSMQYHVEIEQDTVENWGQVPEYNQALLDTLGKNGLTELKQNSDRCMVEFAHSSAMIYKNFKKFV